MLAKRFNDRPIKLQKVATVLKIFIVIGKCVVRMLNRFGWSVFFFAEAPLPQRGLNQIGNKAYLETKAKFHNA